MLYIYSTLFFFYPTYFLRLISDDAHNSSSFILTASNYYNSPMNGHLLCSLTFAITMLQGTFLYMSPHTYTRIPPEYSPKKAILLSVFSF